MEEKFQGNILIFWGKMEEKESKGDIFQGLAEIFLQETTDISISESSYTNYKIEIKKLYTFSKEHLDRINKMLKKIGYEVLDFEIVATEHALIVTLWI